MQETPMLFPVAPSEFWKQIKVVVSEVVDAKLATMQNGTPQSCIDMPEKTLLKATEVCEIFRVSKPTLYAWIRQDKLRSFKIRSRRYFSRADIELVIRQMQPPVNP
ncbi:helix-turn-helix domain-containing protein [Sediminibacterium roseum]|uniref:Helix-turn-helix domain-containing protein n=1 Tax=Sediminibacterium roseum TaxID=1978412 RepID=A0ABX0A477_9BACT|nr:helix-turn-helix domain-containing protein [Sediminibacterium roseum]NCI52010.1 helix-turn-helix domain-containing protein [Sediminibacterium roseum]